MLQGNKEKNSKPNEEIMNIQIEIHIKFTSDEKHIC